MALPIQLSDIVTALAAIVWIKEHCFSSSNSANSRYTEFKQDLLFFERHLLQLQNIFDAAADQLGLRGVVENHDCASRYFSFRRDSRELIGDYGATIEDCKTLLTKYSVLDRRKSRIHENGYWHLNTKDKVNELRDRLRFHAQKISLIIEPIKFDLITSISGRVDEILTILRTQSRAPDDIVLPEIPRSLVNRFCSALQTNQPQPFSTPAEVPLKEGFDALYEHFRNSTFQFINLEHSPQTLQQYLNLLKSRWLLEVLKDSQSLQRRDPESLFRQAIFQIELRIAQQYSRSSITRYSEAELLDLDDSAFRIWPDAQIGIPKLQHEPDRQRLEEKLLKVPLADESQFLNTELHVIRVTEKILRIVRTRAFNDRSESLAWTFNLHEDTLLPWYAINSSTEVQLTTGSGACRESIELKSRSDAIKVQSAFTGYDVYLPTEPFEEVSITATYSPRGFHWTRSQDRGVGEIQLWEWPTVDPTGQQLDLSHPPLSLSTINPNSTGSESIHSVASKITQGLDHSIVTFYGSDHTSGDGLLFAKLPPPPLIVGFTRKNNTFTMWHIDVSHVKISEQRDSPPVTVIKSTDKRTLAVRKFSLEKTKMATWDLCTFVLSNHPGFYDQEKIERIDCTYIALCFPNTTKWNLFNKALKLLVDRRSGQMKRINESVWTIRAFEDKPQQPLSSQRKKGSLSRRTSVASPS